MTVLVLRPMATEVAPEHRRTRYNDLTTRLALVEAIAPSFASSGKITDEMVREVARRSGRCRKRARQMCREWLAIEAVGRPVRESRIPEQFWIAVAEHNGNVSAALRSFYPDESDQRRYRSSIYRAMDQADVNMLAALRAGRESWAKYGEVGVFVPQHRNELWLIDETKIPILARTGRGGVIDDLSLIAVFDTFSRLCVNAQVTIGATDATTTAAVLARALAGGTWEDVDYGGSPDALGLDNTLIFKSDLCREVLALAGVDPRYARPYTPEDKAMLERWNGTLKQKWLTSFPAYTDGPVRRVFAPTGDLGGDGRPKVARTTRALHVPLQPEHLPSLEDVTQGVYAAIHDYNANHLHSVTGMTPIARFGTDVRFLRRPGIAAFWQFALPIDQHLYVGERRGVHVNGEWRKSADLSLIGREVTVRCLPGLDPRYLVGDRHGRFLTEVARTADETPAERHSRRERNRQSTQRLSEITRIARANSLARATGNPGTSATATPRAAENLAASTGVRPLASIEAALSIPEWPETAA